MVERQPRHDAVVGGDAGGLGHRMTGGDDVLVSQDDAARAARRARGVLQERDVLRSALGQMVCRRSGLEIRRLEHGPDAGS